MKALQYFSDEYLKECKKMTPDQIAQFLDEFRLLHGGSRNSSSKLISLKVPEDLLQAFKAKAKQNGLKYQTQIKLLMREWIEK